MSYAERAVIQVSKPVKDRLDALKIAQQQDRKRQVSISEVIEQLLDDQRAFARIGDAWRRVEQAIEETGGAA